jgi:hypothetical protein
MTSSSRGLILIWLLRQLLVIGPGIIGAVLGCGKTRNEVIARNEGLNDTSVRPLDSAAVRIVDARATVRDRTRPRPPAHNYRPRPRFKVGARPRTPSLPRTAAC